MRADGDREALRLPMIDRDNATASAKTARTALAAILVTAPAPLRERLRHLPRQRRAKECAALTCPEGVGRPTRILHQTLIRLGHRIAALTETAAELEAQITQLVEEKRIVRVRFSSPAPLRTGAVGRRGGGPCPLPN